MYLSPDQRLSMQFHITKSKLSNPLPANAHVEAAVAWLHKVVDDATQSALAEHPCRKMPKAN
eukprot:10765359-Prorocentrum_lima.AAC.1